MSVSPPRFGIWAFVHGSRAALQDPDEPYTASWERNRRLILQVPRVRGERASGTYIPSAGAVSAGRAGVSSRFNQFSPG